MTNSNYTTGALLKITPTSTSRRATGIRRWRFKSLKKQFQRLLPNGVASKDQYLYAIVDDAGRKVGVLWLAVRYQSGIRPYAFVYDFLIDEEFRRRGYGRQAFEVLEEKVKEMGLDSISLHVFGHNQPAIALYQAAGYETTDLQMVKRLSG